MLQVGNNSPCLTLRTLQSKDVADNRLGSTAAAVHSFEWVWETGLKWMRVIVDPLGRWQYTDWEVDDYGVAPDEERIIDNLVSNGVRIMLVLDVWGPENRVVYYKSEEDIARYLKWVHFMVRHFKGRVGYYEILNEPDLNSAAPSWLPLEAYRNLIKLTVPVIRAEDPVAKIVVGTHGTLFDHQREYTMGLLNSEEMAIVDGFSWHPMYGSAPSDDPRGVERPETPQLANYWESYPGLVKEIMRVGAAAGFRGEYLVEEMIWRTPAEASGWEPHGFTDVSGAKYYARAIIIHLGLGVMTGVGFAQAQHGRPRSHGVIRALATVMVGAMPAHLTVRIESAATNIKSYGFTLPNGGTMVALWTDGPAVEDDPGIEASVTVPGVAATAGRVVGIDVLRGFEQGLNSSMRDGSVVISGLLVRDYPLILLFTNP